MPLDKKILKIEAKLDKLRIKHKDSEDHRVAENVFDDATLKTLYYLSNRGYIEAFGGSISTGKEANVFDAVGKNNKDVAIKIYRISSSNFKAVQEYILGDHRFENVRHNRKNIVLTLAKKEFQNLKRARDAGVRVPQPFVIERNVLIMEFIGQNSIPSPQLRNVKMALEDTKHVFEQIVEYMRIMYCDADMVHSDLSEYNILIEEGVTPVIIDIGQGVLRSHPMSEQFLKRDVSNVIRFFKKRGVNATDEQIMTIITQGC